MTTAAPTSTLLSSLRAAGFTGPVVEPRDCGYDAVRRCWNGTVDRRPAAIARATDAEDVAAAIKAARDASIPFTVRAGGHSVAGRSVRDGALCIDLRALNRVEVDPGTRRVAVGGGALLGEMDAATQRHGLAVPGGQVSHTGVGGLTLGGGLGWLMRKHGLTIDSLEAVEAVLADGSIVRASAEKEPELFWALRGGGGDFAAVTRFEFRGHPVGQVLAGLLLYPWERAHEALAAGRELMEGAPDEMGLCAVLLTAPPGEPFPEELRGKPVAALSVAWCGELAEGERALAPLRAEHPPLADMVGPMPYVALQSMIDETAPHGLRYHDRLHYLDEFSDGLFERLVECFEAVPTPQSHIITGWMGGAVGRVPAGATAFGHRHAAGETWLIGCSGTEPIGPTRDWVRSAWSELAPHAAGGTYVNALEAGAAPTEAYTPEIWARLVAAKCRYDPDGAFSATGIA